MLSIKTTLAAAMLCLLASGCSTISGSGTSQSVSFKTVAEDGKDVENAKCELKNDEGTWFVTTPGSSIVHRSNKNLQVICKKDGMDTGGASVVSRTTGNMYGNILLGGGIGAIIDHNNGSAYEYPGLVKIFMGRMNQIINSKTNEASAANKTPTDADIKSLQGNAIIGFATYEKKPSPKAFAIADDGHWSGVWGRGLLNNETVAAEAVTSCTNKGFTNCRLFAVSAKE